MRICSITYLAFFLLALEALPARAQHPYVGRNFYFALLGTNHKNPLFTKEFTEGTNVVSIGGVRQLWLPEQQRTIGFKVGYDDIRHHGGGIGWALTLLRNEFDDTAFAYDEQNGQHQVALYRVPTHTLAFLDLNGTYLPWRAGRRAAGVYGMVSLVGDFEKYHIDKYGIVNDATERFGLTSEKKTHYDVHFGYGFGLRFYLMRHLNVWLERRWIAGERFSTVRDFTQGGFLGTGEQRTLYARISSLGLGLVF
jgi:hypothetical protein